jgi:TonB family protein
LNADGAVAVSGTPTPGQSAGATADTSSSSDSDASTIEASKSASQTAKQDTMANHSNGNPTFVAASLPASTATKSADLLDVPEDYADDQVIHRVHPGYPKQARLKKLQGTVVLQAIVNKQGKVDSLQLISGDPLLAQAAADAVKQWRYKPYSHEGEPTDFQTRVTVDFRLP